MNSTQNNRWRTTHISFMDSVQVKMRHYFRVRYTEHFRWLGNTLYETAFGKGPCPSPPGPRGLGVGWLCTFEEETKLSQKKKELILRHTTRIIGSKVGVGFASQIPGAPSPPLSQSSCFLWPAQALPPPSPALPSLAGNPAPLSRARLAAWASGVQLCWVG